ncbi:neuropeptide FF receptor 2-like [Actinia tenebrosa]|uniref:Neuropeptide FF receptor 2-like n=1 Tax=Actinia tenebrosa TaxID=6105 RepID=A0A6P8HVE5_ACTTE|nr:neuropeptide FF receptor 2-like [Actinia tenebrosa]XP_031559346.1 neuropeptide FF receptor 2-like [Actinia tenebrosa]
MNYTNTSIASEIIVDNRRIKITQLFFYVLIAAVGAVGNTMICISILRRTQRKMSENFILNLAVTDLAVSTISIPLDVIERVSGFWPYGAVLCKIVYPFQTILMAVSVATLLAMSLERHRVIIYPFKPRIKGHSSRIIIIVTWIGSIILVSPYILVLSYEDNNCIEVWPNGTLFVRIYTMSVFVALYLCPLIVITIAYLLVAAKLYRDIKRMRGIFSPGKKTRNGQRMIKCRAQRNLRIVKIFIAAVFAFAVCFLPTHVMWLWHDFGSGSQSDYFTTLLVFANILVYANSSINPFIFGTLQSECNSCYAFFRGPRARRRGTPHKDRKFSFYSFPSRYRSASRSCPNNVLLLPSREVHDHVDHAHQRDWAEHVALNLESNL